MLSPQCESNVSGRAGIFRDAQPGPNQANREGVSGYQADSRSKVTGSSPEAKGVSQYPWEAQGNYVVGGAINMHAPSGNRLNRVTEE